MIKIHVFVRHSISRLVAAAHCRVSMLSDMQVVTKLVTKLDLSESDVSDASLTVIATSCPLLRSIDLNAAKMNRTAISSQGFCSNHYLFISFSV